jgi:glycerol-3-phosphate dehydrogenase (NAD(P)+)
MAKVGVIGGGAFGTAMACVLRRSGNDVTVWAREPEVVASLNEYGANPHFLPGIPCVAGIRASGSLDYAARADFLLLAVPSIHVREVAQRLAAVPHAATLVVSCAKGLEPGGALMPEVLGESLPRAAVAVLSGPTGAREIAVDLPCGVALACADAARAAELAEAMRNRHFAVHPTDDVPGVAVCGAMKNVAAIASGVALGRSLGEGARATLVGMALEECRRLAVARGGRPLTLLGAAGAADFMRAAYSPQSRNASFGVALAHGRLAEDILAERRHVTEGAHTVPAAARLARELGLDLPLTQALDDLIARRTPADTALDAVLRRPAAATLR